MRFALLNVSIVDFNRLWVDREPWNDNYCLEELATQTILNLFVVSVSWEGRQDGGFAYQDLTTVNH